jgi:hypothetical protein
MFCDDHIYSYRALLGEEDESVQGYQYVVAQRTRNVAATTKE